MDLGRGVSAESAAFSWSPAEPGPAPWLPPRDDLASLSAQPGEDSGSLLQFNPDASPEEAAIQRTLLQLSADALVSADDLPLLPVSAAGEAEPPAFGGFQSRELNNTQADEQLASSRWLLVSSGSDGATRHTAFYRPLLNQASANTISGLGLPPTLIDAAGARLLELSLRRQDSPDAVLLRQRGTARELSPLLAGFTFTPD